MKAWPSPLALMNVTLCAILVGACTAGIGTSPTSPPIPRVGLLHVGTDHVPPSLGTLVARLAELGWIDGSQGGLWQALPNRGASRVQGWS